MVESQGRVGFAQFFVYGHIGVCMLGLYRFTFAEYTALPVNMLAIGMSGERPSRARERLE